MKIKGLVAGFRGPSTENAVEQRRGCCRARKKKEGKEGKEKKEKEKKGRKVGWAIPVRFEPVWSDLAIWSHFDRFLSFSFGFRIIRVVFEKSICVSGPVMFLYN
ncbi:hypothetical protein JCGZ_09228 [Jatropha curcas]|uniref:Uncharacterized protein n=1 Tax=Jatropha curcas TaxID=180498 RepID=A0A067KRM2_JATCU|nr:hypothetical protein JCGZ_09228 [Jatropha curcas]